MQELPFLHSARRLMLIDICMKFLEDSFRGFQVTERTRFVTDRRTDRRPGKNNMSPNPSGGDIIMNDYGLEQLVPFPSRERNTLDLIITSLPGQFVDIHSPDRLSDHDIVSGTLKVVIPPPPH